MDPDYKNILQLGFPKKFLPALHTLNTPKKIQNYLTKKIKYNHDDTLRSFIGVMETHRADCFEGAVSFAYVLLYLRGYNPRIVFIQAENDVDHTLAIYKIGSKFGSIAISREKKLMGRLPIYSNLYDLIMSYYPYYKSIYPEYSDQLTMVGFSDPVDLVKKFGTDWFFLPGDLALKHLYDHVADHLMCTNIFTKKRYPYPPEI